MRIHQFIISTTLAVAASSIPGSAIGQTSAKSSVSSSRITHAIELQERAVQLHSQPARAEEAAALHKRSARLRHPGDPEAVQSLAMAAHLFGYAKRYSDARRTMEEAAERALAMGDVLHAAQAYIEAAFFAQKQSNRSEINRLGRKAVLLAGSPVLAPDQRAAIMKRVRSNPSLADLAK